MAEVVVKSPRDCREYRALSLENGLRVLLVSDQQMKEDTEDNDPDCTVSDDCESGTSDDENEQVSCLEEEKAPSMEKSSSNLAAAALCVGVGSFSDPDELPGLAHLVEHMLFMGSEKYPKQNEFDAFLKKHGGLSNASTDCEQTLFHFEVRRKNFKEALDRFAQFFVSPLLNKRSSEAEIQAVDSEFQMSLQSDAARKLQLLSSQSRRGNPFSKFLWGNMKTLQLVPQEQGLDVNVHAREFYARAYSANYMTLVVVSGEMLDTLENWVTEIFSQVPKNGLSQPSFGDCLLPFDELFHHVVKVQPVKEIHQVDIVWQLPCMFHTYRCKPLHYVGWLLGHEGPGSVLSVLRQKGWALEIVAGNGEEGYEYNSSFSLFSCSIILTEEGLMNVFECCSVVFQYLEMLRCRGPQRRIFDELKTIEDIEFQFQEQMEPVDFAVDVVKNMQLFCPEEYLTGDTLMFEFDEQMIVNVQNALLPGSANITILSSNFTQCDLNETEPWFQTAYLTEEIPKLWDDAWSKLDLHPDLHFPPPNRFIATYFDLKPPDCPDTLEPVVIYSTDTSKLWFKKDSKFHVPKAHICLNLLSPLVKTSPMNAAMTSLFLFVLEHNLKEIAYAADVAQLSYSFVEHENCVVIKMSGFNDKLPLLFDTVTDYLANFTCDVKEFGLIKAQVCKNYHNLRLKPTRLSKDTRLEILQQVKWTVSDKLAAIDSVDVEQLQKFVENFKVQVFVEGLIEGNMTSAEAVGLLQSVCNKLKMNPLLPSQVSQLSNRCLLLPRGAHLRRVGNMNEKDVNSVVTNYYQIGLGSVSTLALNDLLVSLMEEPCFDVLRTQEQLGYSVFCTCRCTSGVLGLSVTVCTQATKFSTTHVDERIDSFLQSFVQNLKEMPDSDFQHHVEGLVNIKLREDLNLTEVVDQHWPEIVSQTYLFDRRRQECDALKTLSREHVIDWLVSCITPARGKRKLSIQIVGRTQEILAPTVSCAMHPVDGTESLSVEANVGDGHQVSLNTKRGVKESHKDRHRKSHQQHGKLIEDVHTFKDSNLFHSVWKF